MNSEEFSGVKKINFFERSTMNPFDLEDFKNIKLSETESLLNEEIDLLSLWMPESIYDPKDFELMNLPFGVTLSPTLYDPETFEAIKVVCFKWSPDSSHESNQEKEMTEETILSKIKSCIEKNKATVTPIYKVLARFARKSVKQKVNA